MPNLQTLPIELHENISSYLLPRDTGALALSCKLLFHSLGPNNQLLWYRLLSRGISQLVALQLDGVETQSSWVSDLVSYYGEFDGTGRKNYWVEACGVFSGQPRVRGCRLCLNVSLRGMDREIRYPIAEGPVYVTKRYCRDCFGDWFVYIRRFKDRYPDIKIPNALTFPGPHSGDKNRVLPIYAAIERIQQSCGVPYEIALKPSNRFISKWVHYGRDRKEAIQLDYTVKLAVEVFKREYKHIQIGLPLKEVYTMLTEDLVSVIISPNASWKTILGFASAAGEGIVEAWKILFCSGDGDDGGDDGRIAEATNIILDQIFSKLFCKPDDFRPELIPFPQCQVLKNLMNNLMGNDGALSWLIKFSSLHYPEDENADEDENNDSQYPQIRCYWCLKQNNGIETGAEDDLFGQYDSTYLTICEKWIMTHVMTVHRDRLWVRPKGRAYEEWKLGTAGPLIGRVRVDEDAPLYIQELLGTKVDFEKEEMEEIPPEEVKYYDEFITESTYFLL
ncbi:uncharacterized protein DFL_002188 [Arthrobotrys flagrans]|uniref:F-box domain-containing protein n=1 Tax=Arthrobotrys flagrans TaxID=97331 RepID=A0A437AA81_ARTFL|nr:hypothetical protein DFL_002188 [Arthrobotrys flagrans]